MRVAVIGAGPAGIVAALRAAELGATTTLLSRGAFGGMAANDGPVPVRTLAHAARLARDARQLAQYGIAAGETQLDYVRLLNRVQQVVTQVRTHEALRSALERAGVTVVEEAGTVRFVDANTLEFERGPRLAADRVILCTGGASRRLAIPGFDLTATHSDAWALSAVPASMLVIGVGATGAQVASVFNELGSHVELFEAGPRILATEDEDVSAEMAACFRARGIAVVESFGRIDRFESTSSGVRMIYSNGDRSQAAEASVAVVAIGWQADTLGLNLAAAGVSPTPRGYVAVDEYLRTSAPHVFAAGDVTGRMMFVPHAMYDGYAAATNAVQGLTLVAYDQVSPVGSFTDPEYAHVGMTEAEARAGHEIVVAKVPYSEAVRPIIDGHTDGFCKLVVDRATHAMLGCHIVGERAVELAQIAAVGLASAARVEDLARIPWSFPTYTNVFGRAVIGAARQLNQSGIWSAEELAQPAGQF
ncbi:MAG: NAD(P)/FAD-dependent oxidoreductase [Chloroflexi bacterium]|nr:NAD(P)/FAD-dependent oxidoreductase [Chloroflexota bacterium]